MTDSQYLGSKSVRMSAEEITQRSFASKVRGLSESEVRAFLKRVADEVNRLGEREDELLAKIKQMQENFESKPKASKAELLEILGEQTTKVLSSAEEAAEQMVSEAKAQAEEILRKAKEESESKLSQVRSQVQSQLEEAQSKAKSLSEKSNRDSETIISHARSKGREIFQESVVVREQILKDLLRRRDLLLEQIEELRNGRESLLDSYKVVKSSFQQATDALSTVEEKAASELMANPIDVDQLLKAPVELPAVLDSKQDISQVLDQVEQVEAKDVPKPVEEEKQEETVEKKNDETEFSAVKIIKPVEKIEESKDESQNDTEFNVTGKRKSIKNYMKDALGVGEEESSQTENKKVEEQTAKAQDEEKSEKKDVNALFESIKNHKATDTPAAVQAEKQEEKAEVKAEAKTDKDDSKKKKSSKKSKITDAVTIRDEAIAQITSSVTRKAKRQLQDEQNEILESLRTVKPKKRLLAENILSDENTHVKNWEAAIGADLEAVFIAGAKSVSDEKVKYSADSLQSAINWIVTPLRETLVKAIDEGEPSEATNRVGAKYREWRNADLKSALFDAMSSAYNNGVVAAAKGNKTLKWSVEKAGRCPDCDDNALEPTLAGETFPTGQVAPPAHSGCKCVLAIA
ncbi:MAG: DivIVA domain-containing protein [Acidimicrobiia bacterium]